DTVDHVGEGRGVGVAVGGVFVVGAVGPVAHGVDDGRFLHATAEHLIPAGPGGFVLAGLGHRGVAAAQRRVLVAGRRAGIGGPCIRFALLTEGVKAGAALLTSLVAEAHEARLLVLRGATVVLATSEPAALPGGHLVAGEGVLACGSIAR